MTQQLPTYDDVTLTETVEKPEGMSPATIGAIIALILTGLMTLAIAAVALVVVLVAALGVLGGATTFMLRSQEPDFEHYEPLVPPPEAPIVEPAGQP